MAECIDCNLHEFICHWTRHSLPLFMLPFPIVYIVIQSSDQYKNSKTYADWFLEPRTRWNGIRWLAFHLALLLLEVVEGHWILTSLVRMLRGYKNWHLPKHEWFLQFWQAMVIGSLGVGICISLVVGFVVLVTTLGTVVELLVLSARREEKDEGFVMVENDDSDLRKDLKVPEKPLRKYE